MALKTFGVMAIVDAALLVGAALDMNLVLNLFTLALIAVAAVPVLRSRRKDAIIKELNDVCDVKERREKELEKDLAGAQARANQAEEAAKFSVKEAEKWQARYEEQSKYTAPEAVMQIESELAEHRQQVAERHERILTALERLTDRIEESGG